MTINPNLVQIAHAFTEDGLFAGLSEAKAREVIEESALNLGESLSLQIFPKIILFYKICQQCVQEQDK